MERYVYLQHRRFMTLVHAHGVPAVLYSCGQVSSVINISVRDISYDGKHSYGDAIVPVEEANEQWYEGIAVLSGMDVGFLAHAGEVEIIARCRAMLERAQQRGYALSAGNSVPEYAPLRAWKAMRAAI